MPISSNLGYSSIARPGVCTSGTRPASPYQGQVIYETDTGRTLVWNATAWAYLSTGTANPVGTEYVSGGTFTNQPYFEVTGFSTLYNWYEINFAGVRTGGVAASTAVLGCLYNGATARNSAYYGGNGYMRFDGTSSGAKYNQNNAGDFYGTTVEGRYRGNFTMRVYFKAGEQFTYNTQGIDTQQFDAFYGAGFRNATDTWDRIRFTGFTANIDGVWTMRGIKI